MTAFLEIKFNGGLGNQLFQYAAARNIAIEKKVPFLLFNLSEYREESFGRKFSLINYNIKGKVLRNDFGKKLFRPHTKLNNILNAFFLHEHIKEYGFVLHNLTGKIKLLASLDGYWQSDFYFKSIRKQLLNELQPISHPTLPIWHSNSNTVAIHVRRTDYLYETRYGFLGQDYYCDAISYFKNKIQEPLFILFSDDMPWCKEHFKENNIVYVEDKSWEPDHLQLFLMSTCKHQIIANSSFSWWGAWLNMNAEKIVVRPITPFNDASLLYKSHYPEEWVAIKN